MHIFKEIADLQLWLAQQRKAGNSIAFIPTMGALHHGHLTLVEAGRATGALTVASIFVNPTQFNDPKDLEKYPRTPEKDLELLLKVHCDAVFFPEVTEIYPVGKSLTLHLDFGTMEQVMEGKFRPGHFNGMATVVKRLLDIVQPNQLYMGQKDYQQLSIVRQMLFLLGSTVELVMVPTVRESDGLAMSSRNVRLSPEMRALAPALYKVLSSAAQLVSSSDLRELEQKAMLELEQQGFSPEYFEIVDGHTLLPLEKDSDARQAVICTAVWAQDVRLIDNVLVNEF
jgi:pantoate--beta-alanine ligase